MTVLQTQLLVRIKNNEIHAITQPVASLPLPILPSGLPDDSVFADWSSKNQQDSQLRRPLESRYRKNKNHP